MHHPLFAGWGDAVYFHDLVAKDIERLSRRLSNVSGVASEREKNGLLGVEGQKMRQELSDPGVCVQSLAAMLLPPVTDSAAKPPVPGGDPSSARQGRQGHVSWRSLCGELADRAAQLEVLLALLSETMARCLMHTGIVDADATMVATASACPTSRVAWLDKATIFLQCANNTVTMWRPDLQNSSHEKAPKPCADEQRASCSRDACAQTDKLDLLERDMMANGSTALMEFQQQCVKEVIGGPEKNFAVRIAELHAPDVKSRGNCNDFTVADSDHTMSGAGDTGKTTFGREVNHTDHAMSGAGNTGKLTFGGEVNHTSCGTQTERSTVDAAASCCASLADVAVQVSAVIAGVQGFRRLPTAAEVADAGVQAVQATAHASMQVMPATVHASLQAEEPEEESLQSNRSVTPSTPGRSSFRAALEQEEMLREHTKQRVTVLHEALLLERREAATVRARLREAEQALEELQHCVRQEPQVVQLPTVVQLPEPQPPASVGAQLAPQAPHQAMQDSLLFPDAAVADVVAAAAVTGATQLSMMSASDRPTSAARFAAPQVSQPRRRAWTPSRQNPPAVARHSLGASMRQNALL